MDDDEWRRPTNVWSLWTSPDSRPCYFEIHQNSGYPRNSSRFVLLRTTSKCPHSYYHRLCRKIHQGTCSCRRRCRRFTAKCASRRRSDRRRSRCTLFNAHTSHSVFSTNHCAVLELQARHIIVCLHLQCFLFELH